MTKPRIAAAILLATGAIFFASQMPVEVHAQDAKAEKKAKKLAERQKALAEKEKAEADKAKPNVETAAKETPKVAPAETKPANPMDGKAVAKFIDAEINKKLAAEKIVPSSRSSDAEFLRRASLDIAGVIPASDRVEAFLNSDDPDKRAKLIDELLANPKYGQRLADIWSKQIIPADSMNRFVTKEPLTKYLSEAFNANKPWDQMAHEILTATGEQQENGAVSYFMFNQGVDKMTDSVGKLFLGVQIQCAQCHNHPFTTWKQTEYWGLAQFFYNVNVVVQRNGKQTDIKPGVSESPRARNRKGNQLPESAKTVPAKFLGGAEAKLMAGKPYRPVLADWLCTAENPFFSKSMVNRVWAQYFGRGLVNPIDDMSFENEASHPEVLQRLAREFSNGGFDLKSLVRAICLSDAYQRTSQPTPANKQDAVLYSHMAIKVLTPEQLYDSLTAVSGNLTDNGRPGGKKGANGPKGAPVSARDRFVAFFGGSENPKATDYEAGIPQALRLINNARLSGGNRASDIVKAGAQPDKAIDQLYRLTLSRRPNEAEMKRLTDYIASASDAKTAYSDILWALLNSSEFALNH